jgi:hypothetical protein
LTVVHGFGVKHLHARIVLRGLVVQCRSI